MEKFAYRDILSVNPSKMTLASMNYLEIPRRHTGIVEKAMNPDREQTSALNIALFGTGSYSRRANLSIMFLRMIMAVTLSAIAAMQFASQPLILSSVILLAMMIVAGIMLRPASIAVQGLALWAAMTGTVQPYICVAIIFAAGILIASGAGRISIDARIYSLAKMRAAYRRQDRLNSYMAFRHI